MGPDDELPEEVLLVGLLGVMACVAAAFLYGIFNNSASVRPKSDNATSIKLNDTSGQSAPKPITDKAPESSPAPGIP